MRRAVAGTAAVLGLAVLLVGAPWALISWGSAGALTRLDWGHALTVRDDGRLLLGVLSVVGWLVWLVLVVSILAEAVDLFGRLRAERDHRPHRSLRLPGLDLPRLLVRGLVVTAVTAALGLTLPQFASPAVAATPRIAAPAAAVPDQAVPSSALLAAPAPSSGLTTRTTPRSLPTSALHVVRDFDDLRGLASRYYGDASQWQRIADANADLLKGSAVLRTGWRLVIPGVAGTDGTCVIVVARGDSLSVLAARYLGDGDRWPQVYALNRDVVADPDEIDVGWRLRLPGAGAPASTGSAGSAGAASNAAIQSAPAPGPTQPSTPQPSTAVTTPSRPTTAATSTSSAPQASATAVTTVAAQSPTATITPTKTPTRVAADHTLAPPVEVSASPAATVAPAEDAVGGQEPLTVSQALALGIVGTVGAGMASAVVRTVRRRRDVQLALRPVGRRIPYPCLDTRQIESALVVVSAAATAGQGVDDQAPAVPRRALIDPVDRAGAVVTAGFDQNGPVTVDLERHRLTTVALGDLESSWGTACAWALELACTDGAEGGLSGGATVVAVGPAAEALQAAALESILLVPSVDEALDDLAAVVHRQVAELAGRGWTLAQARADQDAQDAWRPRVYVFPALDEQRTARLADAFDAGAGTAVSAVVVRAEPPGSTPAWGGRLVGTAEQAVVEPEQIAVRPVSLSQDGSSGVVEMLAVSGEERTLPAPWFASAEAAGNVLPLHPRLAGSTKEVVDVGDTPGVTDFSHPTLMLLGPIQLQGAAGSPPVRAERSCIEYCAWMVEHPGATASQMSAALLVAETTRRSNVSRLRGWLGAMGDGTPYLPEAYTGRLYLDAAVSSDWQRLCALVSPGINRVPVPTLVSALRLVRGAPLADAVPGQWHWAEELRTDMASMVRDIGAQVCQAALAAGDIDLARWATARALTASPGDELLVRLRLRTEHLAGNRPEVERLVLQLTRHARMLGIDLDLETVQAIQEAIEGQPRARA